MKISKSRFDIEMARKRLTKTALASKAKISHVRLNAILNSKNIRPETAGRIAKALGVDVTEILEEEGD